MNLTRLWNNVLSVKSFNSYPEMCTFLPVPYHKSVSQSVCQCVGLYLLTTYFILRAIATAWAWHFKSPRWTRQVPFFLRRPVSQHPRSSRLWRRGGGSFPQWWRSAAEADVAPAVTRWRGRSGARSGHLPRPHRLPRRTAGRRWRAGKKGERKCVHILLTCTLVYIYICMRVQGFCGYIWYIVAMENNDVFLKWRVVKSTCLLFFDTYFYCRWSEVGPTVPWCHFNILYLTR